MKLFILFGVIFLVAPSFAQNATCPDGQVLCEGTVDECIPDEFICDGTFIDCSNDADEQGCPCPIGDFVCPNSDLCIPNSWICDFHRDCPGGEDEDQDCPPCNGFECNDGECIPSNWVCDGGVDCAGGEDEYEGCTPPPCYGFECSDGDCIPEYWVCDNYADCSNDEENCTCDGFRCEYNGHCIPSQYVCDGFSDCFDSSDELNCTMSAVSAVPNKGSSTRDNAREVKLRKPTALAALSKRKMKRTQKKIREERKASSCSRRSQRKYNQRFPVLK